MTGDEIHTITGMINGLEFLESQLSEAGDSGTNLNYSALARAVLNYRQKLNEIPLKAEEADRLATKLTSVSTALESLSADSKSETDIRLDITHVRERLAGLLKAATGSSR